MPGIPGEQLVAGTAQSLIEARTARRNTDMTNRANRELAEYAYSKDLEMWHRANEYGSPQEQMKRLKAAGLNPNMVYGSGSAAGASAATLPKYQAPRQEYNYKSPIDLGTVIGMYQDVQQKAANIDLTRAMARQKRDENVTGLGSYRGSLMAEQWALANQKAGIGSDMISGIPSFKGGIADYQLQKMNADIMRLRADTEKKDAETLFKQFENQWMRAGVTRSDHPAVRAIVRGWNALGVEDMGWFKDSVKGFRMKK